MRVRERELCLECFTENNGVKELDVKQCIFFIVIFSGATKHGKHVKHFTTFQGETNEALLPAQSSQLQNRLVMVLPAQSSFLFFKKTLVSAQFNDKRFKQKNKIKPDLSLSLALCNLRSLSLSLSLKSSSSITGVFVFVSLCLYQVSQLPPTP